MIEGIEKARRKHNFHLWAYVILPEHVHFLIWPVSQPYSISAILKTIK
jgi:putative transposase